MATDQIDELQKALDELRKELKELRSELCDNDCGHEEAPVVEVPTGVTQQNAPCPRQSGTSMPKVLIFNRTDETEVVRGSLIVGKDSCTVEVGLQPLRGGPDAPFQVIYSTAAGETDTSAVEVTKNARLVARCAATPKKSRCHWAYRIHGA